MHDILFQYEKVNPTSWAYLSSLLMLALFFKFNRVLSVRNFDLLLLISLAPGLLLVQYSFENEGVRANALAMQKLGFLWLFAVTAAIMVRLLWDPALTRRPLLEPNLNGAGLAFLGSSLLFFLMANVVTGRPGREDWSPARPAAEIKAEQDAAQAPESFETQGPGFWLLYLMPRITTQKLIAGGQPIATAEATAAQQRRLVRETTARVMAVLSHVLIVAGVVVIGMQHFGNVTAGLAAATTYLLLPYTASWCGDVPHALPGSLLVWAVVCYRRPVLAGVLIGLAAGTIYYPAFLLPLWCSFYWERGVKRFVTGVLIALLALVLVIGLTSGSMETFLGYLWQMFGVRTPMTENLQGIWRKELGWNAWYRLPVLAAFVVLAISFVAWPVKKHLGTLISCTAALMAGSQFWHAHVGGIFVAWYLPLLLLTVHRPNLEEATASATVVEGWWQRRQRLRAASPTT